MASDLTPASLRGAVDPVGGSRGVSRLASTDCARHRAVIAAGTTPEELLPHLYGGPRPLELSPFAAEAGLRFERDLLADGAQKLRDCYRSAGILDAGESDVQIVPADPGEAELVTRDLLRRLRRGEATPLIVVQPRLHLDVCGEQQVVRPDLLVTDGRGGYRVGEVKSHLDHDGQTDGTLLAAACRQGAVGVLALAETLGGDVPEHPSVDIFLRRDDRAGVSVRTLRVDAEIHAITEGLAVGSRLVAEYAPLGSIDQIEVLQSIPHRYRASCHGACALADACFAEAWERGDVAVMGTTFGEALAGVESLHETRVLLGDPHSPLGKAQQRAVELGLVEP